MAAYTDQQPVEAAGRRRRSVPPVYAALDLGTNNCRLLVARPNRDGFRVIDSFSQIVRLGEGMAECDDLGEEAMVRTIGALKECAEKMARRGVTAARCVATEACRRAGNGAEFLTRVHAETGIRLEIIGADEEAQLAVDGCASLLRDDRPHALVLDIGGGSTELIWLDVLGDGRTEMRDYESLPFGVVEFAERYGRDRVSPGAYQAMVTQVIESLASFERRHGIGAHVGESRVQMLGTSGTVTTLAGILLKLSRYNRRRIDGTYLRFDEIARISRDLIAMDYEERAGQPCIGHERADLVVAGTAILEGICRLWPVGRLRVADRGLREGILLGLLATAQAGA